MKLLKYIILSTVLFITFSVSAEDKFKDYDADYYEDEGNLLFKIRPFYVNTQSQHKNFPVASNPSATKAPGALTENGYGFDLATTYFFGDYIATELALGTIYYRTKKSTLNDVLLNFGQGTSSIGKKNNILMFPVTAVLQYHIAPFGAIRPYIGAGIHATYIYSKAKEFQVDNATGAVIQAGIDFIAKDDTFITLDVKYLTLESKINYRREFLGRDQELSTKLKWNPTVISLGFGFIF